MVLVVAAEEHPKLILIEFGNVYNHCRIVVSGKLAVIAALFCAIAQSSHLSGERYELPLSASDQIAGSVSCLSLTALVARTLTDRDRYLEHLADQSDSK